MRGWIAFALVGLTACGGAPPRVAESESTEGEENEAFAIALRLEDAGDDETETPHTRVTLVKIEPDGARTLEELHVEPGACWHDGTGDEILIAARCWWAGAGAAYMVSRRGDFVIAHRREAAEGDAAGEAHREWEEVGRVEVPEDAPLQVLAPGRRAQLPGESAP